MVTLISASKASLESAAHLVVLMCCYNRRATTIAALESLESQECSQELNVSVVLFDDGSTDGTSEDVARRFPDIEIIRGDGKAYWSKSMSIAQKVATGLASPDYILWLNDDVRLLPRALEIMVGIAASSSADQAVVGALIDEHTRALTYSGYRRVGRRPLQLKQVPVRDEKQYVDTFNGNVVLIPRKIYQKVGGVDGQFEHGLGDIDYGYQIQRAGYASVVAPGVAGTCSRNRPEGGWMDGTQSMTTNFRLLLSRKGRPFRSNMHFHRRHGGPAWAATLAFIYLKSSGLILTSAIRRQRNIRRDAGRSAQS